MKFHIYCISFCPYNVSPQENTAKILCCIVYCFSIAAIIYYHKFSSLNNTNVSSHSSIGQKSGLACLVSPFQVSQNQTKSWPAWAFTWRLWGRIHFQAHSGCWHKSAPCNYRIEVPISLLAVSLGPLYAPQGHFPVLAQGLSSSVPGTAS